MAGGFVLVVAGCIIKCCELVGSCVHLECIKHVVHYVSKTLKSLNRGIACTLELG